MSMTVYCQAAMITLLLTWVCEVQASKLLEVKARKPISRKAVGLHADFYQPSRIALQCHFLGCLLGWAQCKAETVVGFFDRVAIA